MSEFNGQHIAVIGLAATGLATAKVLRDLGATVTVYDGKPEEKLDPARVAEVRELDGVSFQPATELVEQGTDLLVPSPGVPRYANVLTDAVAREIPILGEIEVAYRLAKAPILAITGTNGKTTTTALTGAICREAGLPTWVAGNIAEDAGRRLPLIQAAVEAPADAVIVAEISSFQLEWVQQFRPKAAALLNISADHMDRHKDMDEYARAKSNIFRAQTEEDVAVLNADDPLVMHYSEGVGKARRSLFGVRTEMGVMGFCTRGTGTWHLDVSGGKLFYENRLVGAAGPGVRLGPILLQGRHNLANIMAAIGLTTPVYFGGSQKIQISVEAIGKVLETFRGVAHRMELVEEIDGVRYINNSMCTNPAALVASVSALDTPLISISGGIHKGGDLTEVGKALATYARHTILIGKSAGEFADAIRAASDTATYSFADSLPEAVKQAAEIAQSGDTVMLAPGCASFDMFSGFEERGQVFRDAVKERVWQS